MNVKDIMSRKVISTRPETPVKEVLDLMVNNRISGLPVVDEHEHLLGFIPERNLLIRTRMAADSTPLNLDHRTFVQLQKKLYGRTAGDIMNTQVLEIDENADLMVLVDLILSTNFSRFPVLRGGKKVVGMVTRNDILKAIRDYDLTQLDDEELGDEEIVQMLLLNLKKTLPSSVSHINLKVRGGVATLTGYVADLEEINKIEEIIKAGPGVKQILNNLLIDSMLR